MGEWQPDAHTPIAANGVSLWVVPVNLSGTWNIEGDACGAAIEALRVTQKFQMISGDVTIGGKVRAIRDGRVSGNRFSFTIDAADDLDATKISGTAHGEIIRAQDEQSSAHAWQAQRAIGTRQGIEP